LITVVKILCEIKRANHLELYYKKPEIAFKLGPIARPTLNFALHTGWVI
jgi:hypothetical protein